MPESAVTRLTTANPLGIKVGPRVGFAYLGELQDRYSRRMGHLLDSSVVQRAERNWLLAEHFDRQFDEQQLHADLGVLPILIQMV